MKQSFSLAFCEQEFVNVWAIVFEKRRNSSLDVRKGNVTIVDDDVNENS
jgi:hypothetical protein